jgi:hypothetical protein
MCGETLGDRTEGSLEAAQLLNAAGRMSKRARNQRRGAWGNLRYNSTNQYRQSLDFAITLNERRNSNLTHCGVPIVALGVS